MIEQEFEPYVRNGLQRLMDRGCSLVFGIHEDEHGKLVSVYVSPPGVNIRSPNWREQTLFLHSTSISEESAIELVAYARGYFCGKGVDDRG